MNATTTTAARRDTGAVLVFVAIVMVVLLGVGALVLDIGAAYVEKRQLQNGADAAALAVAQECATGEDCGPSSAIAESYADANANDGAADVTAVCGVGPGLTPCSDPPPARAEGVSGWVRVIVQTETAGGGNEINYVLAPVMNAVAGATIDAAAVAAYGALAATATLPIILSVCEFQQMGGDVANQIFPTGTSYVYSKRANPNTYDPECTVAAGGGTAPGNFGWLETAGGCTVPVTKGGFVNGDPGNDPNPIRQVCGEDQVRNAEVVLPLFDAVNDQGGNVQYHVAGFVGFRITGYQLSGTTWPSGFSCPPPLGSDASGGNLRCFRGEFTRVLTSGQIGGGTNYGASVVQMIG